MSPSPRERLQRALDAEIQGLKLRRNALSPVSSLPPEVFTAIFSLVCFPGTLSLGGGPDYHLARLRVSHVCRQWREIALNQPLLWSHVDFSALSSAGVTEILARAKSVPLYLNADFRGYRWNDILFIKFRQEVQARVPHVRHLKIRAGPTQLHGALKGLFHLLPHSNIFRSLPPVGNSRAA
ncbi:hypothetical protein EI94DRAFT_466819 [Lactarius quietus]|nr:hypothetical protein EI94DRAFT_466819 [Lactarius quietus]